MRAACKALTCDQEMLPVGRSASEVAVLPFVEVRSNGELSIREDDPGFDYEDDLRSAEDAVATVVGRRVFVLHGRFAVTLRVLDRIKIVSMGIGLDQHEFPS